MAKSQTECPIHAMHCDPLPNDLMFIVYDHTKNGIPDYSSCTYRVIIRVGTRDRGN